MRLHFRLVGLTLAGIAGLSTPLLAIGCSSDKSATTTPGSTAPPISSLSDDKPDDALFKFGQEAVINERGIEPKELVAIAGHDVTIRNTTPTEQTVVFINGPADDSGVRETPPIPPGATFVFRPQRPIQLTYRLKSNPDSRALVQVEVDATKGPVEPSDTALRPAAPGSTPQP